MTELCERTAAGLLFWELHMTGAGARRAVNEHHTISRSTLIIAWKLSGRRRLWSPWAASFTSAQRHDGKSWSTGLCRCVMLPISLYVVTNSHMDSYTKGLRDIIKTLEKRIPLLTFFCKSQKTYQYMQITAVSIWNYAGGSKTPTSFIQFHPKWWLHGRIKNKCVMSSKHFCASFVKIPL